MTAVFIAFNQSCKDDIMEILDRNSIRGFTFWEQVQGRGTDNGEPHYGSHAWPTMNSAIITFVEDKRVDHLLDLLDKLDKQAEAQGIRAFTWSIDKTMK